MPGNDEEEQEEVHLTIDPEIVWAVRTGPDEISVYLGETDTMVFTNQGAMALLKAMITMMEENPL